MLIALIAARLMHFGSTALLFGAAAFCVYGYPDAPGRRRAWPRSILLGAAVFALASAIAWLMGQTAMMTGLAQDALDPSSVAVVLTQSQFGRAWTIRLVLLAALILAFVFAPAARPRMLWLSTATVGALLLGGLAFAGHGGADDGAARAAHLLADGFHLLAAGAWLGALGGLLAMLIASIPTATPAQAELVRRGLERFSGIGSAVVAVLVFTGAVNGWFLIGPAHVGELITSPYGRLLLLKIGLFALMLALAAANRFVLTPRLARARRIGSAAKALGALRASLLAETTLGVLVLLAVSWLGILEPPGAG